MKKNLHKRILLQTRAWFRHMFQIAKLNLWNMCIVQKINKLLFTYNL